MKEFNLKDLFVRQKRLIGQKEELAKCSSRVITLKLSYPLFRMPFFSKKLNYKRSIDENLNKKVRVGFWCKWLNSLWNSLHSPYCERTNCEMLKQVQHDEILHFVHNGPSLCCPEFISGSNRLRRCFLALSILPKKRKYNYRILRSLHSLENDNMGTSFSLQECSSRMTNPIRVVSSLLFSFYSVIQRLSISRASRAYPSLRHPEPFLRRISLFI